MREPVEHLQYKRWLIPITNNCNLSCGNCAQLCGHFPPSKLWHLSLDQIDQAIKLLKPHTGPEKQWNECTIFGGEPTLHPEWDKVLELVYSHAPMQFRINTNGRLGQQPFQRERNVTYYVDKHPPHQQFLRTTMAAMDMEPGKTPAEYWEMAQQHCEIWATEGAMIYNGKAYFCEHAAAMDWLWFNGEYGWTLDEQKNPFDRTEKEIATQAEKFCQHCGWCVPGAGRQRVDAKTQCSESNYELFPRKQLVQLTAAPRVEQLDYSRLELTLSAIRNASIEQLKDWEFVRKLIQTMGLYGATNEVYGTEKEFGTFDATGVWQEPTQSAKFMVWLSHQAIETLLEVGSWNGCWALFMAAYLKRFRLQRAVSVDIADTVLPGVRRLAREYTLEFQQCGSDAYADESFDFTFIDGGRDREVVLGHWDNVGRHAQICAFHDINCRFAPEIGKIWKEKFQDRGIEYLDHACGYGYDVFGIGVLLND